MPFYGVFDNLAFRYEDGVVTLYGQVSRPTLEERRRASVERVAGVDQVINRIEVLPLSASTTGFASRSSARSIASPVLTGSRSRPFRRFTSSSRTAM